MKPLELSEVASVLKKELWEVKNWTSGKPFKIQASLKQAKGSGSRNLYGVEDLWKFEIVEQMVEAGIRNDPVNEVLKALEEDLKEEGGFDRLKKSPWLRIRQKVYVWSIEYGEPGSPHPPQELGELQLLIDVPSTAKKLDAALADLDKQPSAKTKGGTAKHKRQTKSQKAKKGG